jgi:hypothetical protein
VIVTSVFCSPALGDLSGHTRLHPLKLRDDPDEVLYVAAGEVVEDLCPF